MILFACFRAALLGLGLGGNIGVLLLMLLHGNEPMLGRSHKCGRARERERERERDIDQGLSS